MNRQKTITVLLICFMIFLCGRSLGESSFQINVPGEISGYQSNPIMVIAPEDGTVSLTIHDEHTVYRVLEKEVSSGKNQILWDGLGWNEERMAQKSYVIDGIFTGKSGITQTGSAVIQVGPSQQAILFALPSDQAVYLSDPGDWVLEFKILYTDQLVSEFFDAESGELILKSSRQAKGARVNQISFYALTGRKHLPEGKYRVSVYGQRHPSYAREFLLEVREGKRPVLPLEVTGDIMPSREDSDLEIWRKMTAPATVINIKNTSHQKVFEEPDQDSGVLGTLHGQSQAVSVLEIQDKWVRISAWNHEDGSPVEGWVPRRVLMVVQPQTEYGLLEEYVNNSSLFDWQKNVLVKISKNSDIGVNARKALASELISSEETRLIKSTNKTDILVKLGPILGLLGTLIPLGPGLAALGSGDITTLAESLTIAFDTTVTGLAVGGLGYLISKFKKQWYESDLIDVETLAEVELESLSNSGDNNA